MADYIKQKKTAANLKTGHQKLAKVAKMLKGLVGYHQAN